MSRRYLASIIRPTATMEKPWSCLELQHGIAGNRTAVLAGLTQTEPRHMLLTNDSCGSYPESKLLAKQINILAAEDQTLDN